LTFKSGEKQPVPVWYGGHLNKTRKEDENKRNPLSWRQFITNP